MSVFIVCLHCVLHSEKQSFISLNIHHTSKYFQIQLAEFTEIFFLSHIQVSFFRKAYKFRFVFREKWAT